VLILISLKCNPESKVSEINGTHTFSFDKVFGPNNSQVDIFHEVAKPIVDGKCSVSREIDYMFLRRVERFQWNGILLRIDRQWKDFYDGGNSFLYSFFRNLSIQLSSAATQRLTYFRARTTTAMSSKVYCRECSHTCSSRLRKLTKQLSSTLSAVFLRSTWRKYKTYLIVSNDY